MGRSRTEGRKLWRRHENLLFLHFFEILFLEFQETQGERLKRCNVHMIGNTKTYASGILRFLNRGLRERGSKETMEERRRQLTFLGFFDSRNPQARSKARARVRARARARNEELNGGGGDTRSYISSLLDM